MTTHLVKPEAIALVLMECFANDTTLGRVPVSPEQSASCKEHGMQTVSSQDNMTISASAERRTTSLTRACLAWSLIADQISPPGESSARTSIMLPGESKDV